MAEEEKSKFTSSHGDTKIWKKKKQLLMKKARRLMEKIFFN